MVPGQVLLAGGAGRRGGPLPPAHPRWDGGRESLRRVCDTGPQGSFLPPSHTRPLPSFPQDPLPNKGLRCQFSLELSSVILLSPVARPQAGGGASPGLSLLVCEAGHAASALDQETPARGSPTPEDTARRVVG